MLYISVESCYRKVLCLKNIIVQNDKLTLSSATAVFEKIPATKSAICDLAICTLRYYKLKTFKKKKDTTITFAK